MIDVSRGEFSTTVLPDLIQSIVRQSMEFINELQDNAACQVNLPTLSWFQIPEFGTCPLSEADKMLRVKLPEKRNVFAYDRIDHPAKLDLTCQVVIHKVRDKVHPLICQTSFSLTYLVEYGA